MPRDIVTWCVLHVYVLTSALQPEPNETQPIPPPKNRNYKAKEKMEKAKPLRCWSQILNPIAPLPHDLKPPFTESELAVAEQLIHLSESSGPTTASTNSMASASSSTRSVNAPASAWTPLEEVAEEDEALWRRNKRYRPIADVYASTVPIDGERGGTKETTRKRKGWNSGASESARVQEFKRERKRERERRALCFEACKYS